MEDGCIPDLMSEDGTICVECGNMSFGTGGPAMSLEDRLLRLLLRFEKVYWIPYPTKFIGNVPVLQVILFVRGDLPHDSTQKRIYELRKLEKSAESAALTAMEHLQNKVESIQEFVWSLEKQVQELDAHMTPLKRPPAPAPSDLAEERSDSSP